MPAFSRPAHVRRRRQAAPLTTAIAQLRIAPERLNALRSLVMRICGDAFCFMRVAICADHHQFKVWLCVQLTVYERLQHAIACDFPEVVLTKILQMPNVAHRRD